MAGAVAAMAIAGRDVELERDALLQLAAGMEGHADNAAASLYGGFVVAWESSAALVNRELGNNRGRYHAVRLDAHPDIRPVALVAEVESSTAATRGLLPDSVPLADAAFTGSRTALAVLAFTARPELLLPATEDRLHQGYRRPAYPASAELVDALRAHGIAGHHLRGRTDCARADHGRAVARRARPGRVHAGAAAGRHRWRADRGWAEGTRHERRGWLLPPTCGCVYPRQRNGDPCVLSVATRAGDTRAAYSANVAMIAGFARRGGRPLTRPVDRQIVRHTARASV